MSKALHALESWNQIADQIRAAQHLALFTDFDGTLVRIQRHASQVRLSARVRMLLESIAHSGVCVGVVSGRKINDVRNRVGLHHIWYAGVHGFFLLDPENHSMALLSPIQRSWIKEVKRALARQLAGVPGIRLEPKDATIAVHYRGAPSRSLYLAREGIRRVLKCHPEVSILPGKKVWELLPDSTTDKWTAISLILCRERKRNSTGTWLSIYLGDDATDELVFQKMEGISIAVGRKHSTSARYFLRSPAEVSKFLLNLKKWKECDETSQSAVSIR
ncbi:MAG: trehalose-phosphatase [Candidatus Acidiferrales bacterium]